MKLLYLTLILSAFEPGFIVQALTLLETLAADQDLTNLTAYLALYPSYRDDLAYGKNFTLLAPTNNAFAKAFDDLSLPPTSDEILALFNYHVLKGVFPSFSDTVFAGTHLLPGSYANVTGGQSIEIVNFGSTTILYSGFLQNSAVTKSTAFDGGYMHNVDRFLTIPPSVSSIATALNLTSAVGALSTLNLSVRVDTTRDYTMLLPNNAAFRNIGSWLDGTSTEQLIQLMEYHMIPGRILYGLDIQNSTFQTSQGGLVNVHKIDGDLYFNNARSVRTAADILTFNGVIHILDRVLNPSNTSASPGSEAFSIVAAVSNDPFTSRVITPTSAIASAAASSLAADSGSSADSNTSSNTGTIAGGVVGGIAAIALSVFLVWFVRRKRRDTKHEEIQQIGPTNDGGVGRSATVRSTTGPHPDEHVPWHQHQYRQQEQTGQGHDVEPEPRSPSPNQYYTPLPYSLSPQDETLPVPQVRQDQQYRTPQQYPDQTQHQTLSQVPLLVPLQTQTQTQTQAQAQVHDQEHQEQEHQRLLEEEQEEKQKQEKRMKDLKTQRRLAEIAHQERMAALEQEERLAELEMTASRLRSKNRTVSELEAVANPGPGSA